MKVLIFGGTTEGRFLAGELAAAGAEVTVSVATEYGAEEQSQEPGIQVVEGAKDKEQICRMLKGVDICIDATHPFAQEVTKNIKAAAGEEGVDLLRVLREEQNAEVEESKIIWAQNPEDAAEKTADYLSQSSSADGRCSRILLTTGVKDLSVYAEKLEPESLFPRVLPLKQSLEACEAAGIPVKNIIAAQGPFGIEFNKGIIRNYDINIMITKQSGRSGGYEEKISACRNCGIPAVVIRRPKEEGISYDDALKYCKERL